MKSTVTDKDGAKIPRLLAASLAAVLLFPQRSHAAEVGCFCTFMFVSVMFGIGLGITLLFKYLLSRTLWNTSWKKTISITVSELFVLGIVFFIIQSHFVLSVLVYFPFAVFINMLMLGSRAAGESGLRFKRMAMSVLSSLALPAAIRIAGALSGLISGMITLTEIRV